MKKRPFTLTITAWTAIILGGLWSLGAIAYFVGIYTYEGNIYLDLEITGVLQFLFGIFALIGGIGILKVKEIFKILLLITYGTMLFLSPLYFANDIVFKESNLNEKVSYIMSYSIFFVPIIFTLIYLNTKNMKEYFKDMNHDT
jgi:hypothetical protein